MATVISIDHKSFAWRQGPLAPPLERHVMFMEFLFGFVLNPIAVQIFSVLGYLEGHEFFPHVKPMGKPSGAPSSTPGKKFRIIKFFPIVLGQQ
jgi:hypothetical protein